MSRDTETRAAAEAIRELLILRQDLWLLMASPCAPVFLPVDSVTPYPDFLPNLTGVHFYRPQVRTPAGKNINERLSITLQKTKILRMMFIFQKLGKGERKESSVHKIEDINPKENKEA